MSQNPEDYVAGPGQLFIGDPTVALGAGMISCGWIEGDVSVQFGGGSVSIKSNGITKQMYSRSGHIASLTAPLQSMNKELLATYLTAAEEEGDSLGFSTKVKEVKRFTLCFVPDFDLDGSGTPAFAHSIWIPGVCVTDPGQLTFQTVGDDQADSSNVRQTVFQVLETETVGGSSVPENAQNGFIGDPADFGLASWSLPI